MITFEIPEEPFFKSGELEVTEEPEVVITISGVKNIDYMHIGFKSEDEEETEDE